MEVTRRRGRRRKKLLDDLKNRRGYSHLKEEALDRTMWRNRFGGGFGPVFRQNTEWMNTAHSVVWRFLLSLQVWDSIPGRAKALFSSVKHLYLMWDDQAETDYVSLYFSSGR